MLPHCLPLRTLNEVPADQTRSLGSGVSALQTGLGAPLALSVSTSLVLIRLFWLGVSVLQTSLVLPLACLLALKLSNCLVLNQVLWIRGVCTADQPWCSPLACFFAFLNECTCKLLASSHSHECTCKWPKINTHSCRNVYLQTSLVFYER